MSKKFKIIYHEGEPSSYGINKKGIVKNLKTNHIMRQRLNINGYFIVRLSFEKYKRKEILVHRLLAQAFIPNPENKPYVHHIDKNKLHNSIKNLQWVTNEEHCKLHENDINHPFAKCEKHPNSILTDNDVHKICLYIENNTYSQIELSKIFNVDRQVISDIRHGMNWKTLSMLYDFTNYHNLEWEKLDDLTVINICNDIVAGISIRNIAKKYKVDISVIRNIYNKKTYKKITEKYIFPEHFLLAPRRTNDFYQRMDKLILEQRGPKFICEDMNIPYSRANKQLIYRRKQKIM